MGWSNLRRVGLELMTSSTGRIAHVAARISTRDVIREADPRQCRALQIPAIPSGQELRSAGRICAERKQS